MAATQSTDGYCSSDKNKTKKHSSTGFCCCTPSLLLCYFDDAMRDERLARTAECQLPLNSPPGCRVDPVFRTLDGSRRIAHNCYAQLTTSHLLISSEPFANLVIRKNVFSNTCVHGACAACPMRWQLLAS